MADPPLFIEGGHRLCAGALAARGVTWAEWDQRINLAQQAFHQRPALIDLGHHPIRINAMCGIHHGLCPDQWPRALHRAIGKHIGPPVLWRTLQHRPHNKNAAGVRGFARAHRRVNRHNHTVQRRGAAHLRAHQTGVAPQCALYILQKDPIQFLPPQT